MSSTHLEMTIDPIQLVNSFDIDQESIYDPIDNSQKTLAASTTAATADYHHISFKVLFYDPRWNQGQRRCCLSILILLFAVCCAIILSIFVGVAEIIQFIDHQTVIKSRGLEYVPIPPMKGAKKMFILSNSCDEQCHLAKESIELSLNRARINTTKDNICKADSAWDQSCRFNTSRLFDNPVMDCTSDKDYGFSIGQPCILLSLHKLPPSFRPRSNVSVECEFHDIFERSKSDVIANVSFSPLTGFDHRHIVAHYDHHNNDLVKPMLMMQVHNLHEVTNNKIYLVCAVNDVSLDAIRQIKILFKVK